MLISVKDLLQELVRIPSVNPAFSVADPLIRGEAGISDFSQNFSQNRGWPWLRQVVHPGRDNLLMVCRASGAAAERRPVLWDVHQDTVGVTGMKIAAFAASESQGRIWGRGACDVKGGMAAMLAALARVEAEGAALERTVVLALTVNEECGFTGVKALCRLWGTEQRNGDRQVEDQRHGDRQDKDQRGGDQRGGSHQCKSTGAQAAVEAESLRGPLSLAELRDLRPARAIVAEPTLLNVVVAHKGSLRWRCHTRGKAAHTSRPEQGCNAISTMVRVVQSIEQYHGDVLSRAAAHPLCGRPTVCVSTIQGGSGVNTVPDHAVIDIDRRLLPGESSATAYRELVEYISARIADHTAESSEATIEHEPPTSESVGLQDTDNRPWAEHIAATVNAIGPSPRTSAPSQASRLIGVPYGTDAWALSQAGIPTVVFGPGSIDQAHTDDEWIEVDQLERATEIFYRLAIGERVLDSG